METRAAFDIRNIIGLPRDWMVNRQGFLLSLDRRDSWRSIGSSSPWVGRKKGKRRQWWRRRRRRSEKGDKEMKNQGIKGRLRRRLRQKERSKQQFEGTAKLKEGWEKRKKRKKVSPLEISASSLFFSLSLPVKRPSPLLFFPIRISV